MDGFCKACLVKYDDPTELLQYTEKNKRLFVYSTGLQVKAIDALPFQLCQACFMKMKVACHFKKQCRTADKRLNNFLALKEAGEVIELADYLQMNDGSTLFKFPLNVTPLYQKTKEDDNVSTSTSIRNFVTDFLREDEVPDTEAHIIREMIEQEADVLDDSLDSQWLQDDISIASDFRFSPFSTPLPKHNYQPLLNYSPAKEEKVEEQSSVRRNILPSKHLTLKAKSCSSSETNSHSSSTSVSSDQNTFIAAKTMLLHGKSNIKIKYDDVQEDSLEQDKKSYIAKKRMLLNSKKSNKNQIKPKGKDIETYLATKSILADSNSDICENETNFKMPNKELVININKLQKDQEQITPKGFYVEIDDEDKDSIDKNIEKLLNTTNDDVISLGALLASPSKESIPCCNEIIATPSVHQGLSGANTPTIANILFGENLDDSQSTKQKKSDQEKLMVTDDDNNVDILEDFFNKDTGKYVGENEPNKDESFEEYKSVNRLPLLGKSQYDITDFSCKICDVRYKSERGLKIHFARMHHSQIVTQRTREPRVDRACDRCGKIFHCRSNMARHIKVMHINPKKAQKCKLCSVEFTSENKLKLHMKSHGPLHEYKPLRNDKNKLELICPICGHMSTQTSNLKVHMARHNKTYLLTCEPCGRGFYRKTDLRIHMRLHMNEKPFKCHFCPQSFRRKDQLLNHLKKHTGEQPYTCEICGNKFATKMKLSNHMKNSVTCIKTKIGADIEANKVIEESIEQMYVEVTLVRVGNENIPEIGKNASKSNEKTVTVTDEPVRVTNGDIAVRDVYNRKAVTFKDGENAAGAKKADDKTDNAIGNSKGPTLQDDDDKMSLSDLFTIPKIIQDKNAAGAKEADDKTVNAISNCKELMSQDDDYDKMSLSDFLTIPKITKDKNAAGVKKADNKTVNSKESMSQDDDDDKMSLSDLLTIPNITKDKNAAGVKKADNKTVNSKESMSQDDDDDKMSLSDLLTIPNITKDKNAAGVKKADNKTVNSKESMSLDDDDDKMSLSDFFTIPKIIKDDM